MATWTENILRRVLETGYVRFVGGKLLDKNDNEIVVTSESTPPPRCNGIRQPERMGIGF